MLGRVEVLVQCVGGVDMVEFFRGIFAGVLEDDLLPARVFYYASLLASGHPFSLGGEGSSPGRNSVTS